MSGKLNLVTGATGLLGSHIAERLVARGERVRALVRPSSDTAFLHSLGVETAVGDLGDAASVRRAVDGAAVVYHCAARVSDWGPWALFQAAMIDSTRNLMEACRAEGVGRVLYLSSISVYGRPRLGPSETVPEDAPLGQNLMLWDNYARAKIRAEQVAREYGPAVTIIRPSWCYGERDRVSMPRVIEGLRGGLVFLIGRGDNVLNVIYAGDVAEGAILAANHPAAAGQTYNLSSAGEVTQARLVNTLTDALGLPRVRWHVPFWLAVRWALALEMVGRVLRRRRPPLISRRAIYLVGRTVRFSTQKARVELGWRPQVDIDEGVRRTLVWYLGQEAGSHGGEPSGAAAQPR